MIGSCNHSPSFSHGVDSYVWARTRKAFDQTYTSLSSSPSLSSLEKEENRGDGGDNRRCVCLVKCSGDVKRKRQLCRVSCPCAIETSLHITYTSGFEEEEKPARFRCTPPPWPHPLNGVRGVGGGGVARWACSVLLFIPVHNPSPLRSSCRPYSCPLDAM